jgi:hypothetical protein
LIRKRIRQRRHDSDTAAIIDGTGRNLIINTLVPTAAFDSAQTRVEAKSKEPHHTLQKDTWQCCDQMS